MTQSSQYKSLQVTAVLRPILNFLEQRPTSPGTALTAEETALSTQILLYGSQLLKGKDLEQFLLLSKSNPDGFYQLLTTLAEYEGTGPNGSLRDFLAMVRRSFSEPEHLF